MTRIGAKPGLTSPALSNGLTALSRISESTSLLAIRSTRWGWKVLVHQKTPETWSNCSKVRVYSLASPGGFHTMPARAKPTKRLTKRPEHGAVSRTRCLDLRSCRTVRVSDSTSSGGRDETASITCSPTTRIRRVSGSSGKTVMRQTSVTTPPILKPCSTAGNGGRPARSAGRRSKAESVRSGRRSSGRSKQTQAGLSLALERQPGSLGGTRRQPYGVWLAIGGQWGQTAIWKSRHLVWPLALPLGSQSQGPAQECVTNVRFRHRSRKPTPPAARATLPPPPKGAATAWRLPQVGGVSEHPCSACAREHRGHRATCGGVG